MNNKTPSKLEYHKTSRVLDVHFGAEKFELEAEYLRVYSPSAEVKGHGPGQEILQHGKKDVAINDIEPNGHYAIRLTFDDGHDSGIFSWDYLYLLGSDKTKHWQDYLARLQAAGKNRDPDTQVLKLM